jgi:hypothetical protein
MQSVLNNYELQIPERIAKYTKTRFEEADRTTFFMQTVKFLLGEPSPAEKSIQKRPYAAIEDESTKPILNESGITDSQRQKQPDEAEGISAQYFQNLLEQAEVNESGLSPYPIYHFDRHFAAGMISISSSMHSLLCQAYFRPYIIDVTKSLIKSLIHLRIPESFNGRLYGDFFYYCIDKGYILVGVYRNGNSDDQQLPIVCTNCKTEDVIYSKDLVFAIKRQ